MNDGKTIYNLQILRFLASAMVLFGHTQHEVTDRNFLDLAGYAPFDPVFFAGGVDVFFVISGFIMYHLTADKFGQPGQAGTFVARRLIRIVPPYWFFTIAMLAAAVLFAGDIAHSAIDPQHVLGSFFFIPTLNPYGKYFPFLILGWTLNFEVLFYAIFACGLLFGKRTGLAVIFLALGVLGLIGIVGGPSRTSFAFWCNSIVFEFLMGIGLAHLRRSGFRWSAWAGAVVFIGGVGFMVLMRQLDIAAHFWNWRFLWMGVPALLLCAGLALVEEGKPGALKRFLVFGGDASYALYLSHPFTINFVATAFAYYGVRDPWLYVLAGCVASFVAAAIFYVLVERPVTDFLSARQKRGFFRPRPVVVPVTEKVPGEAV